MKYLTFSYDDGVTQDKRLVELLNKYGMKGTFNINSGLLGRQGSLVREGVRVDHIKNRPEEIRTIYDGHEVAGHTLTHPLLPGIADDAQIVRQVEEDRVALSELCGYEVVGFAYPGGGAEFYNTRVRDIIRDKTGVKYARLTKSTFTFDTGEDLFSFYPTIHHHAYWDELFELGEKFINLQTDEKKVFYVWGHSYEFDIHNSWDKFEEFLKLMSDKKDILYVTNKEALL